MSDTPKSFGELRELARRSSVTRATVERHVRLEQERTASGKPPWFSFGNKLSEKQLIWLKNTFPQTHEKLMSLVNGYVIAGESPLFVSLTSAAGAGLPGTKSISIGLTPGVQPLDDTHTPLEGSITTTKVRNELFRAIDSTSAPLVFVEFSSPVPAMEYEADEYAKAKFHALVTGLCERLAPGGFVYFVLRSRPKLDEELRILFRGTGLTRVEEGAGEFEYVYEKKQ